MTTLRLPRDQAGVLVLVMNAAPIKHPVDTLEFGLSGSFHEFFYAAYSELTVPGNAGLSLVFTLATHADRVYMTIVNDEAREVARVLANIEDYDRERGVRARVRRFHLVDG